MKQAIICVDDEDIILEALKDQLGPFFENQFLIETSTTAEEALEIYDELVQHGYEVPVVISDYLMPSMRGDEFLIKIHERNPNILKILLTGHANIEGIANAINNANLYRFIPKPWDRDDLILTVREAIRSFIQELEIRRKNIELQEINDHLEILVKERTAELANANATKDKFFSIIAHDLKNSFNGLLGYSNILLSDFDSFVDMDKIKMISAIKQVSENTYKLLQNLLDWARVQTGVISFNPEKIQLNALIQDEFYMQRKLAEQKNILLDNDMEKDIFISADNNMVSTVVRNLLSNAVKFTKSGGKVVLSLKKVGETAEISIKDTGIGISKENLAKLFKVNENFKTFGTNNEEGTGLGLILCKEFILKNRGDIKVNSEVGIGTEILVRLPLFLDNEFSCV
ncbi:MAG TPA: hybrid sensor histidine kinase/response regulator [Bacteroidales bacterium]|nr:hybrid sensor histidine kinase/response regulator [Bacteroidales bacterium]